MYFYISGASFTWEGFTEVLLLKESLDFLPISFFGLKPTCHVIRCSLWSDTSFGNLTFVIKVVFNPCWLWLTVINLLLKHTYSSMFIIDTQPSWNNTEALLHAQNSLMFCILFCSILTNISCNSLNCFHHLSKGTQGSLRDCPFLERGTMLNLVI